MDEEKKKGCVYILTNRAFRDNWVKIGRSSNLQERLRALSGTALPYAFDVHGLLYTARYKEVENLLHYVLGEISKTRINKKREFFDVEPDKALETLRLLSLCIEDAELVIPSEESSESSACDTEESTVDARGRKNVFSFSAVGISVGDTVVFEPANIGVVVASDRQVEYEGKLYYLSPFVTEFMPKDKRNTSGAYQGCRYFSYKGRLLFDIWQEAIRYEEEDL